MLHSSHLNFPYTVVCLGDDTLALLNPLSQFADRSFSLYQFCYIWHFWCNLLLQN